GGDDRAAGRQPKDGQDDRVARDGEGARARPGPAGRVRLRERARAGAHERLTTTERRACRSTERRAGQPSPATGAGSATPEPSRRSSTAGSSIGCPPLTTARIGAGATAAA